MSLFQWLLDACYCIDNWKRPFVRVLCRSSQKKCNWTVPRGQLLKKSAWLLQPSSNKPQPTACDSNEVASVVVFVVVETRALRERFS